jgi:hypothetical protein
LKSQKVFDPFRFLPIAVSGWMNQRQLQVVDYLREENRDLVMQQQHRAGEKLFADWAGAKIPIYNSSEFARIHFTLL